MRILHTRNLPALALAGVAVYLMWLAPDRVFGIDTGLLGSGVLLATAWLVIWLWSRVRELAEEYASLSQQLAGLGLVFSLAIGASFFAQLHAGGWVVADDAPWRLGRNVLLMLILWPVSAGILRGLRRDEGIEDERDRGIDARAGAHAHAVLVGAVIAAIIQLGYGAPALPAAPNPLTVAHWLIGALIVASVTEHLSATLQYWRQQP